MNPPPKDRDGLIPRPDKAAKLGDAAFLGFSQSPLELPKMNQYHQDLEMLENLIDRRNLSTVLAMLSEVCGMKESHVAETWQDHGLALSWRKMELKLDRLHLNTPSCL